MYLSKGFLLFTVATVLLFAFFPELDIFVSSLFYDTDKGFYLGGIEPFDFLHKRLGWIIALFIIASLGYAFIVKKKRKFPALDKKGVAFLLTFLLIGPGLVTNTILKEHSGRVRPVNTEIFGGDKAFTPYYKTDGACTHNCSFVSGHAAAGFFFLAFGYLFRSKRVFALAMLFGLAVATARVVQGGHFLSDVIFAFIINFIILKGVYWLFFKKEAGFDR